VTMDEQAAANRALLERFYTAFSAKDAAGMNACYADDVRFHDPVFEQLSGDRARGMWSMLTATDGALAIRYEVGRVTADEGDVSWIANYNFSATGRPVENHVNSHFWFADGLVKRQEDSFSLHTWASQALGIQGRLLGWSPPLQAAIRGRARRNLDRYMAEAGAAPT
jgi:ketosteroid isomerase-like protein